VITLARGKVATLSSSSKAAKLLSATKATARPGNQRTTSRIICHARSVKV